MNIFDFLFQHLDHPFFMVVFSILLTFGVKWSVYRSRFNSRYAFFQDQKDEIAVTLIIGLMLLIWDDELISAWLYMEAHFKREEYVYEHKEFHTFYYFLVGPGGERLIWLYQKLLS